MPELSRPDLTLHYELEGEGPPLLLLAGMLGDSASWAALAPLLTPHFTVVRPDNRSTGRTSPWDAPADMTLVAEDALALMDHLGFETFFCAGHSMGGIVTLELAHAAPERVTRAAVLASGRVRSPRTMAVFDALTAIRRAPEGEEMWLRALYPWLFGPAFFEGSEKVEAALAAARAYPHAQSAEAMAHQIAAFRRYRPKAKLDEITCPTLVLYAGADLMIPPELARPSFAALSDLTEVTIAGAGHSIAWDAPEEVAEHLVGFMGTA
ncbi:MAG: alpha/beta fold hydrolase [Sulfitobacter sp.]|nr:alpha/beta fold hydrolase [Sulfitobacter sp.]